MTKPFSYALALLQGGALNTEAGDVLASVVKAVDETGKAGRVTITIDIVKAGAALAVTGKVTDKTPEEKATPDMYWPTVEGHLSLQNPNQRNLEFEAVPNTKPAVEHIDKSTGEIVRVAG